MREAPGDDTDLVGRLRAGDPRAFEDLVRIHQHRVFSVALRMLGSRAEAEDIAQEVFLRVHRAIRDFRSEARLSTWLYGIASNLCLNRLASSERKRMRYDDDALMLAASDAADATAMVERAEIEAALRQAIAELPDERRILIVLRDPARPEPCPPRLVRHVFMPMRVKPPVEAAAFMLIAGLAVMIFQRSPEMQQGARFEQPPTPPPLAAPPSEAPAVASRDVSPS